MSEQNVPVTVRILDKEYRIACPREEKEGLLTSAEYLNSHLREIRHNGKAIGADRILALAALNITHELLTQQWQQERIGTRIAQLREKACSVLEKKK